MKKARPCFLAELLRKRGTQGEKASSLANRRQSRNGRVSLGKRGNRRVEFGPRTLTGFAAWRDLRAAKAELSGTFRY